MRMMTKHRKDPLTASGTGELKLTAVSALPAVVGDKHFTLATGDEAAPHELDILCHLSGTGGAAATTVFWLMFWHPLAGDSKTGEWRATGPFPVAGTTAMVDPGNFGSNCYKIAPPKNVTAGYVYWPSQPSNTNLHVMVDPGD